MTYSRISRCLLHILLNIRTEDMTLYKEEGGCPVCPGSWFQQRRSKAFDPHQTHFLCPALTKLTQTEGLSKAGLRMLRQDIFAADLYESVIN